MTTLTCQPKVLCREFFTRMEKVVSDARKAHTEATRDGEGFCEMPGTCGPAAWAIFHGTAQALHDEVCPHCGEEALRLVRGLHDVVNVKLGKPAFAPDDLAYLGGLVAKALRGEASGEQTGSIQHRLPDVDLTTWPQDHEVGVPVCQARDGSLSYGPMAHGDRDQVRIPLHCPGDATPVTTLHSHVIGPIHPSDVDLDTARINHFAESCVGSPRTGELVCERV